MATPVLPNDLVSLVVYLVGLVVLWAITSVPVYFAGKLLTSGRADFLDAMGATLGGALAYFVVYLGVSFFLGAVLGSGAFAFAVILGAAVWLAAYRVAFRTSWVRAIGIVLLSLALLYILNTLFTSLFGVGFPKFFPA